MSDFSALIKAILDTSDFPNQIKKIEQRYGINLKIEKINTSNLEKQMASAGKSVGNNFAQTFNQSLHKINLKNGASSIANMQKTLKSMNFKNSSIDLITRDLKEMNIAVNNVRTRLQGGNLNLSIRGTDELGRTVTVVKQFNAETGRISTISQTFSQSFNQMSAQSNRLSGSLQNVTRMATTLEATTLGNKMNTWMEKNTRASKQFGSQIENLRNKLNTLNSSGKLTKKELDGIEREFKEVQQAAIATGKTGKSFGMTFKSAFQSILRYVGVSTIIYRAIAALKEMYQNVYDIDTKMTELKKVTDETASSYSKFLKSARNDAKEIGTSIADLVESTAGFARLGYSFEDSQELAEVANIYSVVGDEVENVDEATKSLVSTMAAFGDEVTALEVIDKFNEVGNNFAISSGGIGNALQRSASSLSAANNTLDQSIALISAANTVVQDPETVGTAFKTISMRIRGAKTELENAGLETEGMVESTAKLREEILALSGVDIMLDDETFKSTYDILDELAQKWEGLTDIQRATVIELASGKRQGNVFSSLMENFDLARAALETSEGSEGSATREHEKWLESLEAKALQFKAAMEELSVVLMDNSMFKNLIDTGTTVIETLSKIIETVGALPALISTVVLAMSFKNVGKDKMFSFIENMPKITLFPLDIVVFSVILNEIH